MPLIGYLESTDPMIRRRAVEALGPIQDASARRALRERVAERPGRRGPRRRGGSPSASRDRSMRSRRLEAALSGSERVRINALQAIGLLQEKTSVPKVLTLLSDPGFRVRQAAASCLGAIKSPAAVPRLLEMVHDPDDSVRKAVFDAARRPWERSGRSRGTGRRDQVDQGDERRRQHDDDAGHGLASPSSSRARRSPWPALSDFAAGIFGTPWHLRCRAWPEEDREHRQRRCRPGRGGRVLQCARLRPPLLPPGVCGGGLDQSRRRPGQRRAGPRRGWRSGTPPASPWRTTTRSSPTGSSPSEPPPEQLYCIGRDNVVKATLAQGRVSNATDLGTHDDGILKFCTTVNGQFFATTSGRSVRVWSTEQAKATAEIPYGEGFSPDDPNVRGGDASLQSVSISEDGSIVLVTTATAGARVWQNGKLTNLKLTARNKLVAGAIRLDGQALLLLDAKGMMTTHDMANGKLTGSIQSPSQERSGLYFLDSKRVLQMYGELCQLVRRHDGRGEEGLFDLTKFDAVDLSADQSTVVAGDNEATPLYMIEVSGEL